MSEGRGRPGGPATVDLEVGLRESLAEALARRLGGEQHRQVGRQRLEPGDLHDLHSRLRGARVEGVDHLAHERDLSGQVHVVGAARDARLDHRPPVQRVGAAEVEHHPRAGGHRRERAGSPTSATIVSGAVTPTSPSTCSSLAGSRATAAQRAPSRGARSARYAATWRPVIPVAPKTTTSRSRSLTPADDIWPFDLKIGVMSW